ncbi:DEAD/DEAH box helicase [Candidatus Altiarchaeota archaeon]
MKEASFEDLFLIEPLRKVLMDEGYDKPTPIQVDTIPHILMGRDIIGCAQTGTGKTAAFALPIIQLLHESGKHPKPKRARVLVITPTRELAAQIGESFSTYGRLLPQSQAVVFGGVKQGRQVNKMARGVQILIATPGRLLDLMDQRHIRLDQVEIFVLDEADRMLDMGFIRDIKKIIAKLPHQRQSLFFSATMSKEIIKLADTILDDPIKVSVTPESPTVDLIDQKVMFVDRGNKIKLLTKTLTEKDAGKTLVFTRTKHAANKVASHLSKADIPANAIHGNKSQGTRTNTLNRFRSGETPVLVATDIAARGIDVEDITHVINYEIPDEPESYVHRIGRTARAGASGTAISFCEAPERDNLRNIERFIKRSINVVDDHPFHSQKAQEATGADAKRPPKNTGKRTQNSGRSRKRPQNTGKPKKYPQNRGNHGKRSQGKRKGR